MDAPAPRPRETRLVAYVALGVLSGLAYAGFDALAEARIGRGTLTGAFAEVHTLVDRILPVLVGALLGVFAHYFRIRAQLVRAEEAAGRAEALRHRLQKVERDQAVWVLAATVLHELNNPLHALGLLLDELDDTADAAPASTPREAYDGVAVDEGAARRRDLIARARGQADRALSHLRALRAMRGLAEPNVEKVALDRVLATLADDVGSLAREEGLVVRVEAERPVSVQADPAYVRTIVENLVDNSLHALRTSERAERGTGAITIRLGVERGRAIVRISDDGPPLEPEIRDALFEPLRSTGGRSPKGHGLGLGLPIARALARAMRGDLRLDEREPKTFRLELPLGDAAV